MWPKNARKMRIYSPEYIVPYRYKCEICTDCQLKKCYPTVCKTYKEELKYMADEITATAVAEGITIEEAAANYKQKLYTINGQTGSLKYWGEQTGISWYTLRGRIANGMTLEQAIEAGASEPKPKPKPPKKILPMPETDAYVKAVCAEIDKAAGAAGVPDPEPEFAGLVPRNKWNERRRMDIAAAVRHALRNSKPVPLEWVQEYNEYCAGDEK